MSYQVHNEDCLTGMANIAENSIDAIVTDPPYGLSFMGKGWDHGIPGEDYWRAAMRVAKPGAYLLAFGGTRTYHRMACAIEDAGWEIRDSLMWVYGSGFPKSLDVSKAIDKAAGAEREIVGYTNPSDPRQSGGNGNRGTVLTGSCDGKLNRGDPLPITAPSTDAAKQWEGWGTALKPAFEPIILARKPLAGTVAKNVQEFGTGAMNIDGCRVGGNIEEMQNRSGVSAVPGGETTSYRAHNVAAPIWSPSNLGRWPANLIHDGSDEVLELFPQTTSGLRKSTHADNGKQEGTFGAYAGTKRSQDYGGDSGSAARFFYCAKASKADRDEGLNSFEPKPSYMVENGSKTSGLNGERYERNTTARNNHPTVKPTALMRYLCKLITPPAGLILDPFTGSGSTGKAALLEGFRFEGFELEAEYAAIARARCAAVAKQTPLLEAV